MTVVTSPAMRTGEGFPGYRHTRTQPVYWCDIRRSMRMRPFFFFVFYFSQVAEFETSSTTLGQEKSKCFASRHRRHSRSAICINRTRSPALLQVPLVPQPLCPCHCLRLPLPASGLLLTLPLIPPTQLTLEPWHIHDHLNDPKQASGGWPMVGVHHPPSVASALCG